MNLRKWSFQSLCDKFLQIIFVVVHVGDKLNRGSDKIIRWLSSRWSDDMIVRGSSYSTSRLGRVVTLVGASKT